MHSSAEDHQGLDHKRKQLTYGEVERLGTKDFDRVAREKVPGWEKACVHRRVSYVK